MDISKGLIISEPWIGKILAGEKTWEMRSRSTSHRGWFCLIAKGTGKVCGVARLDGCGTPLQRKEMAEAHAFHGIPQTTIESGAVDQWTVPWYLSNVTRLPEPVPYHHNPGAVTWVCLDSFTALAVTRQLDEQFALPPREAESRPAPPYTLTSGSRGTDDRQFFGGEYGTGGHELGVTNGYIGEAVLTEGNLKNNHIYFRSLIDRFPPDVVGGSNKKLAALRQVTVDWGGPVPEETDIDGEKKFFRKRAWIGAFFAMYNALPGDRVVVVQMSPYCYAVRLEKTIGPCA